MWIMKTTKTFGWRPLTTQVMVPGALVIKLELHSRIRGLFSWLGSFVPHTHCLQTMTTVILNLEVSDEELCCGKRLGRKQQTGDPDAAG